MPRITAVRCYEEPVVVTRADGYRRRHAQSVTSPVGEAVR